MIRKNLLGDSRGGTAIEFALIAPALIAFIVGIAQLGVLFMANAGIRNAIAEGARLATIHPRPTAAQIQTKISASRFGLDPTRLSTPTITYGTVDDANFAEITMTYSVPLNFIFFTVAPVTLTQTRRAFIHPVVT